MIRIVFDVQPARPDQRVSCAYCSCCFDVETVSIRQLDEFGGLCSYVCVGCFLSGVDHLRARLREGAEYHRRSAERCEAESTGPIELPSVELYRAMLESPVQVAPTLKQ
jgi:hypothetical protein